MVAAIIRFPEQFVKFGVMAVQKCLIALGGNLQISREVFEDALAMLQRRGCPDARISRVIATCPVGSDAGGEFLNAAAVLQTDHAPDQLLQTLHEVESIFHRVRTRHWGPRTLDLDLILYGKSDVHTPQLVVPHPAMWYRRFVLEPAVDVAAQMIHPILNESVGQLYERLMNRPLRLEICDTQCTADSALLHEILNQVNNSGDATEWYLTDAETCIAPNAFGRIIVRHGTKPTLRQPFNRKVREIEVVGDSVPDIVSQIESLQIAMLGYASNGAK